MTSGERVTSLNDFAANIQNLLTPPKINILRKYFVHGFIRAQITVFCEKNTYIMSGLTYPLTREIIARKYIFENIPSWKHDTEKLNIWIRNKNKYTRKIPRVLRRFFSFGQFKSVSSSWHIIHKTIYIYT